MKEDQWIPTMKNGYLVVIGVILCFICAYYAFILKCCRCKSVSSSDELKTNPESELPPSLNVQNERVYL